MEKRKSWGIQSILAMLLLVAMMLPCAAAIAASTSVADPKTIGDWSTLFGTDSAPTTQHAGDVWVDKSVFTKSEVAGYFNGIEGKIGHDHFGNENFLISLSTIGSNTEVKGFATVPTDTMIVLDLSSSMYGGSSKTPGTVQQMVNAVNQTIKDLQALNNHNRVGVVAYLGGGTVLNSSSTKALSRVMFLPLGRYTHRENKFLKVNVSGGKMTSIQVNSGVKNSAGNTVSTQTHSFPSVAGTYMQQGIIAAMEEFLKADPEVPADAGFQAGQDRMPIMVLMSDGEPTAASSNYSNPGTSQMGNNQVANRSPNQTDFVTQLSAAYAKQQIDAHYSGTTPLVYTLSLGSSVSYNVMDPKNHSNSTINNYWSSLVNNESVKITVKNYKTTDPDDGTENKTYTVSKVGGFPDNVDKRLYVDEMFSAATANNMADAFKSIVAEIELRSRYYGTHVSHGNIHEDGYVEFTDEIGGFMEVKEMLGLYVNGTLYTGAEFAKAVLEGVFGSPNNLNATGRAVVQALCRRLNIDETQLFALLNSAVTHGQLAYTSDSQFSNYLGWFADANNAYLAPYSPSATAPAGAKYAVRSYVYMGRANDLSHSDSDWFYALVRVRKNLTTGREIVDFKLPAALMPLITYEITVADDSEEITQGSIRGLTSDIKDKAPVSLLYEVGLMEEMKAHTLEADLKYLEENNVNYPENSDGSYSFYTNRWRDNQANNFVPSTSPDANIFAEGNSVTTVSRLVPSTQNELYYFVWDTVVTDKQGNPITDDKPTTGYYKHTYVTKDSTGLHVTTHYDDQIHATSLQAAVKKDGQWIIPAGTPKRNLNMHWTATKENNKTNTLSYVDYPVVMNPRGNTGLYETYVYQGNNGKVTVTPAQGIRLTKKLTGVSNHPDAEEEFTFQITFGGQFTSGTYNWVKVAADGTETTGTITIDNATSVASVTIGPDEVYYLLGLPVGTTYSVSEVDNPHYEQHSVVGDTGTIAAHTLSHVDFTNQPDYAAVSVTIDGSKALTGRDILPDEFTFQLFAADDQYQKEQAIQTATNDLNGSFAFEAISYDKPGTHYYVVEEQDDGRGGVTYDKTIFGVKVVVTKNDQDILNVTKTYHKENSSENEIVFKNTYRPKGVTIQLGGKKFFSGRNLVDGEFIFDLYETDATFEVAENQTPKLTDTNQNGAYSFALGYTSADIANHRTHHYYVIRERVDDSLRNIFYDKKEYHITVTVFDNYNGQLIALVQCDEDGGQADVEPDELHFYNAFMPDGVLLKLRGTKELTGKLMEEGEFTFELYRTNERYELTGEPVETVTNDANGEFVFSTGFVLTREGANRYVVLEKAGEDPMMAYDETLYYVTAYADTDPTTGALSLSGDVEIVVAQTGKAAGEVKFINHYTPDFELPETGDASNLAALAMMAITSSGAALALSRKRKR